MHIVQTWLQRFSQHNGTLCVHPLFCFVLSLFKKVNTLQSQCVPFVRCWITKAKHFIFIFEHSQFSSKQSPVVRHFSPVLLFVLLEFFSSIELIPFIYAYHMFFFFFFSLCCCSKIHLKMSVASQNDIRFLARNIMQFSQVRFSSFMLGYLYRINCFLLIYAHTDMCIHTHT